MLKWARLPQDARGELYARASLEVDGGCCVFCGGVPVVSRAVKRPGQVRYQIDVHCPACGASSVVVTPDGFEGFEEC